jgi:rubrerythrin
MAKNPTYDAAQLQDLLLQMMETELGGEQVYRAAISCAINPDLKKEFEEYLEETLGHQNVVRTLCEELGVDPDGLSPSRSVVQHIGQSLVKAMELAKSNGSPAAAQLVACECVVHAETKDHANWELLGKVADAAVGPEKKALKAAHEKVEKDEDHHLYHSQGWCRELAIENLGMPAVLPPPEEVKQVETAIGASRAEQQRTSML